MDPNAVMRLSSTRQPASTQPPRSCERASGRTERTRRVDTRPGLLGRRGRKAMSQRASAPRARNPGAGSAPRRPRRWRHPDAPVEWTTNDQPLDVEMLFPAHRAPINTAPAARDRGLHALFQQPADGTAVGFEVHPAPLGEQRRRPRPRPAASAGRGLDRIGPCPRLPCTGAGAPSTLFVSRFFRSAAERVRERPY